MHKLIAAYTAGRIARREVKPITANRQRNVLRSFADTYGRRDPKNLSRHDIERWIATRGHLSLGTLRYEISTIRRFTRWLQIERHLKRDPMVNIRAPKVPRRVPRALSHDQCVAIWHTLPDARAKAIIALMLGCGLRRAEVISVQVGDWDRTDRTLHVTGKGDHQRVVPVIDKVATVLNAYLGDTNAVAGPLIRRASGHGSITTNYISQLVRRWMEESGVKEFPRDGKACHSFRHTLASNVVDVEPDLRIAQELLGHTHLSSTQVYLRRATLAKIRAAMESAA